MTTISRFTRRAAGDLTLPLDLSFDGLPVGALSSHRHIVRIRQKFSAPQHSFDDRLPSKDVARRDTFKNLHTLSLGHLRKSTA